MFGHSPAFGSSTTMLLDFFLLVEQRSWNTGWKPLKFPPPPPLPPDFIWKFFVKLVLPRNGQTFLHKSMKNAWKWWSKYTTKVFKLMSFTIIQSFSLIVFHMTLSIPMSTSSTSHVEFCARFVINEAALRLRIKWNPFTSSSSHYRAIISASLCGQYFSG